MKHVAKIILIDQNQQYLMLYRNNHPLYGDDPDLPGGEIESTETAIEGVLREIFEETSIVLASQDVSLLHETSTLSSRGVTWSLFTAVIKTRPAVSLSWEHGRYEWLKKTDFIKEASRANDVWMHMVSDIASDEK